jgi:hypothetical protein
VATPAAQARAVPVVDRGEGPDAEKGPYAECTTLRSNAPTTYCKLAHRGRRTSGWRLKHLVCDRPCDPHTCHCPWPLRVGLQWGRAFGNNTVGQGEGVCRSRVSSTFPALGCITKLQATVKLWSSYTASPSTRACGTTSGRSSASTPAWCATTCAGSVDPSNSARRQRLGYARLGQKLQRSLVEADHRMIWIVWLGVQVEQIFHGCHEGWAHLRNAPVLLEPGLEPVFLSVRRTASSEIDPTTLRTTSSSASSCIVQHVRPSGGVPSSAPPPSRGVSQSGHVSSESQPRLPSFSSQR